MRKIALVKNNHPEIKRIMLHKDKNGVYLFTYSSEDDSFCSNDEWYETLNEADDICFKEYGISLNDWKYIDEPLEFCQADWIEPVRIKGRNINKPEWGKFEKLDNGAWKEFVP